MCWCLWYLLSSLIFVEFFVFAWFLWHLLIQQNSKKSTNAKEIYKCQRNQQISKNSTNTETNSTIINEIYKCQRNRQMSKKSTNIKEIKDIPVTQPVAPEFPPPCPKGGNCFPTTVPKRGKPHDQMGEKPWHASLLVMVSGPNDAYRVWHLLISLIIVVFFDICWFLW